MCNMGTSHAKPHFSLLCTRKIVCLSALAVKWMTPVYKLLAMTTDKITALLCSTLAWACMVNHLETLLVVLLCLPELGVGSNLSG